MKPFSTLMFLLFTYSLFSQTNTEGLLKYWVQFTDKDNSPYIIQQPAAFLSARAIARRHRQGITIQERDLPVNPGYVLRLGQSGVYIQHTSRWLNGATIIASSQSIDAVTALPFVAHVEYVGKHFPTLPTKKNTEKKLQLDINTPRLPNQYGLTEPQITMVKGDYLHQQGFKGEDMLIAVLDGGFINTEQMPFFKSLYQRQGMISTYDFVDADTLVYESSSHGSKVLSVMAANLPGLMVGTAPAANYICLKTEDVRGEYRVEELNWIAALEYADSIGVDVVNSSLGYSTFSDSTMNYCYADMNGYTALSSRVSDYAFATGMILVNAAGNSGDTDWKYVDTPADGKYVLTIGAVDIRNKRANFSSYGPTADGRIKPDIVALGRRIGVASIYSENVNASNGTSYAAPLITGLVAALWQAFPFKTNQEILDAIRLSSSQATNPNNEIGYGLPNFKKAYELLSPLSISTK